MTKLFGIYNLGNSGGSWMESVINSHPKCHAWEEVRRHLRLPKEYPADEMQKRIFDFFDAQARSGHWRSVGLIKGFGLEIAERIGEEGRFLQMCRNPIRHIHGTRKRAKQSFNGLGRLPTNKTEYFLGRVLWQAMRCRKYLDRASFVPLVRLEDLSASLRFDGDYFKQVMEYITQVEWTTEQITLVWRSVWPRHRRTAGTATEAWAEWWEERVEVPWEKRVDPSASEIWEHWTSEQRGIFLREYTVIMLSLGYAVPEVVCQQPA